VIDVFRSYENEPWSQRLHVWVRARSCPFDAVADHVPAAGRILDIGCGHGLFSLLLAQRPNRQVVGVDIDAEKVEVARRAGIRAGLGNVEFDVVPSDFSPTIGWEGICLVDVLYLLGVDEGRRLVRGAAAALKPGGALVVKEIDVRPRWKFELARYQELAATRVLRITEGRSVEFVPPSTIAAEMRTSGLEVDHVSLQRGRLHPHHLVVGTAR
jgi:2-polyprenyl-3-methyl-5-hydroxy-6-metoxy-1,4-benzoquinol methylase